MKDSGDSSCSDEPDSDEMDQLVELFQGMGADKKQSHTMAAQLSKRATQLSVEREISRVAAMEHLLKVTISGWRGEGPREEEPGV